MATSQFEASDSDGDRVVCVHAIGSDTLSIKTTGGQWVVLASESVEQLRQWLQLNQPGTPPL